MSEQRRYWGKYRGTVVDNLDPLEMGRLQVEVPQVVAVAATWALPCVPYAGPQVGFYFIPPIGANVWVEFEGGRANHPIWVGCFWGELEKPEEAVDPEVKLIQTQTATFIMNDTPGEGGITIDTRDPAVEVPALINMDTAGIQLTVEPATVSMSPEEGITVTFPPNEVSLSEAGISANSGEAVTVEAGVDISMSAGAAVEIEAAADMSLSAGAAAEVSAAADLALSGGGAAELSGGGDAAVSAGGAVEVEAGGDVSILAAGIVDLTSVDVAITAAATEVTSAGIALTGATEATGDLLIDGQQPLVI